MDIEYLAAHPGIMYDRIEQVQDYVRSMALDPDTTHDAAAASAGIRAMLAGVVTVATTSSALAGGYFSTYITLRNLASNPMLERQVADIYTHCLALVEDGETL